MSNLFQKTSSNWARYDKYDWKEDKEGTLYITPSPDAKVSLYNPLKDSEQMVLKAVNLGLMCMDKNNTHLKKDASKLIARELENSLKKTIKHKELGRQVSYQYLIRLELYKLIKHIIGEKEYEGFKIWW